MKGHYVCGTGLHLRWSAYAITEWSEVCCIAGHTQNVLGSVNSTIENEEWNSYTDAKPWCRRMRYRNPSQKKRIIKNPIHDKPAGIRETCKPSASCVLHISSSRTSSLFVESDSSLQHRNRQAGLQAFENDTSLFETVRRWNQGLWYYPKYGYAARHPNSWYSVRGYWRVKKRSSLARGNMMADLYLLFYLSA